VREPVQLPVMTVEQLLEGVPIACDMRREQLGIRPIWVDDSPETAHSRTLVNFGPPA
jgi:hypothetical protein